MSFMQILVKLQSNNFLRYYCLLAQVSARPGEQPGQQVSLGICECDSLPEILGQRRLIYRVRKPDLKSGAFLGLLRKIFIEKIFRIVRPEEIRRICP